MKLRDYLKQFEGLNLESEVYQQDSINGNYANKAFHFASERPSIAYCIDDNSYTIQVKSGRSEKFDVSVILLP